MGRRLVTYPIERKSGIVLAGNALPVIKNHSFRPLETSVGGDAPKDVIKMYHYDGIRRKVSLKTWPTYIAKIGHKWYPNESITEELISKIGKVIGLNIAESELVVIEGVVRFCSRHFHSKDQVLNHGSEILSRDRNEVDQEWIDDLEKQKEIRASITVEDVISALKNVFGQDAENLIFDFIHMILFDCLVGNNDRHYYNWGVITHLEGKHKPYFAPIYDSARGLWWNNSDEYVVSLQLETERKVPKIKKYIQKSVPKISIPGNEKCNHFELIDYLFKKSYISKEHIQLWLNEDVLGKIYETIDQKFHKLMIVERQTLIKETLRSRLEEMAKILNDGR